MNRSHRGLVIAGSLVLVLTNVIALVGAALNRQPPPDSVLALTERELEPQWNWMWRDDENSGRNLRLHYRVESGDSVLTYGEFGEAVWLDRNKLAALGFDVTVPLSASAETDTHYDRMLGREVLLVLELDGPAHARALQAARDLLAHRQSETNPQQLKAAQEALQREERSASRLFVVDAGLDQTTLRNRYPDRTHYAIVHGSVRPYVLRRGTTVKLYGMVSNVRCETINVPLQFQGTVPNAHAENVQPFTLQVAFGSRLEPWIVSGPAAGTS